MTNPMRHKSCVSRASWRAVARKQFGADWFAVHPVIKKARVEWAIQQVTLSNHDGVKNSFHSAANAIKNAGQVRVKEADGREYTC